MEDILGFTFLGILVVLFFYYGYRDDYRRNPRSFIKTIIGVPLEILTLFAGFTGLHSTLRKWIRGGGNEGK